MSAHILYGVDLGKIGGDAYYDLYEKVSEIPGVEIMHYFIGPETVIYLSRRLISADYSELLREVPVLEVTPEETETLKDAMAKLGLIGKGEPKWLLTFNGNE